MHPYKFKLVASQAKSIYTFMNLGEKVQVCCANIYFNQQCLKLDVIPKYARIKVPYIPSFVNPYPTNVENRVSS